MTLKMLGKLHRWCNWTSSILAGLRADALCILLLAMRVGDVARAEDSPLWLGGLMVLTGQYAMQGAAFREGIELAVDEVNARGGINGRKLEFVAEDTNNMPTKALTAARVLLQKPGLIGAITTSYLELGTGGAELQRNKIPVIHLWDASPDIEAMGDFIFGIGPWTPSAGEVSAEFATKHLRARSAVTFHINDPWSQLVTDYFERDFKARGGTVLRSFAFNPAEQDFRSAFAKARLLKPEVIYCPIGDNIVAFYTQLRKQNPSVPIITSDVIADEHIRQAPAVFEGIYQSQMRDPHGAQFEKLAAAYKRKFSRELSLPWFVATAYDAANLMAHCAEKVGPEPSMVRDCIATTKEWPGVSATISFNAGGSSPQQESIFRLQNGRFTYQPLS